MATKLVFSPYVQHWDGAGVLQVRLLLLPRGSPVDPLAPGAPSFAAAKFVFDVHVVSGLDALPVPGGVPAKSFPQGAVATAQPIYDALAAQFQIDPAPPPAKPRAAGTTIKKHLPLTYQNAVGFTPGTANVFTDDTYSCAITSPSPKPFKQFPPPDPKLPWGKVIAKLLRQPKLAEAAGLIRAFDVPVDPAALANGGFVFVTLAGASDGAALLAVPDGIKLYASRIPALSAERPIFAPVLFPVAAAAPPGSYDAAFAECTDYDDGFAKAVHCAQPEQFDPFNETPDGSRPAKEFGIRIGWDDEQVTTWLNRAVDVAAIDAPLGVLGYRVDTRLHVDAAQPDETWHSLVRAEGPVGTDGVDLGTFSGELAVETHPVQMHAQSTGDYWLPTYFTVWNGSSLVGLDRVAFRLSGGRDLTGPPRVVATPPDIALRYGREYDFRVRLMDHTGGGPEPRELPSVPGPAPVGTIPFRRWVRPLPPTLVDPPPAAPAAPDVNAPRASISVKRPLLTYPTVACTAFPNAVAALLADLPVAIAERREPGLPDPDVDRVRIVVEAQGLAQDPRAADAGYAVLYTTTRAFPPGALNATAAIDIKYVDVHDATALAAPAAGPIVVPRARNVRLRISSLCRDDADLAYFGAQDVRTSSAAITVNLRANALDERKLFAPDLPAHRFAAHFLQPDPVEDATVRFAQRAAGNRHQGLNDAVSRFASALGLRNDGLTLRGRHGRRAVFGCSHALRHVTGPDGASLTFGAQSDLVQHWLVAVQLTLDRDWTWDGLAFDGIVVERDGVEVGRFGPSRNAGADALAAPQRSQTDLVFVDAIDPKPPPGVASPDVLHLTYTVRAVLQGSPAHDPDLTLAIDLPVTTPPSQRVAIASAGIAMSPYRRDAGYTQTEPRTRALWLELERAPDDGRDRFFARVLRVAPDPLISKLGDSVPERLEPPLAIDPESIRTIVQGEADDRAGLDAMQELIPSDSPVRFMLPLPAGMDADSPELFGFFTYELRVGHHDVWSTAQGRFGAPLRVTGVQHPPPQLTCAVVRDSAAITVSAPFALPVIDGASVQQLSPRSEIWVLLYAQAEQIDAEDRRNVLLARKQAPWSDRNFDHAGGSSAFGTAKFGAGEVRLALEALAFDTSAPLSVLAVELLPNGVPLDDPLGSQLGDQRVLRTSPLVPVPAIC